MPDDLTGVGPLEGLAQAGLGKGGAAGGATGPNDPLASPEKNPARSVAIWPVGIYLLGAVLISLMSLDPATILPIYAAAGSPVVMDFVRSKREQRRDQKGGE